MVNWWEDRTFYQDPEEDIHFKKYYAPRMYCRHGQPNYVKCWSCHRERENAYYEEYCNCGDKGFKFFFEPDFDPCENSFFEEKDMDKVEFCNLRDSHTLQDLKKEYYKLCKINHPDKGGDPEVFKRLNNLYHNLINKF